MRLAGEAVLLASVFIAVSTFTIDNCGPNKIFADYAVTIAQKAMIRPLDDVQLGVHSTHGYKAMYKSEAFKFFLTTYVFGGLFIPVGTAD